jgi:hypothetical protein
MCDYSLEHAESRLAAAGDRLITTSFPGSTTRGFCDAQHPDVAVCLRPGTELVFDRPVMFSGLFAFLLQAYSHDCLTARFRHVNENNRFVHHDALEFANGQVVLLTHLRQGQSATVLQLPAEPMKRSKNISSHVPLHHAPALV